MPARFVLAVAGLLLSSTLFAAEPARKPNILVIVADDQGYGDIGCYGATGFKTPNLDRLAAEGMRFTSFYTGCSVCSGSRAALLTGRHYRRVGVPPVMFPGNKNGIPAEEVTIAEVLKDKGYATAIVGKWHLGHLPPYLPMRHGFDSYYGIPYSNDMSLDPQSAKFAASCVFREGFTAETAKTEKTKGGKVPLMRGDEVIEYPADQTTLTKRYTEEAVRFIQAHKDKPFFLYLPHTMPHLPMACSAEFKGRTKTLFGDVMEEIDWSVGEIRKAVADAGIDRRTLIIFTTDNGTRSGSSGPLRAQKASLYEGGYRVPCIMRWPGQVPAKTVCDEVAATIDVLPTLARLVGSAPPGDRPIDGKDIRPLMFGVANAKSPHEYYILPHLQGALRHGNWKYYPWPEAPAKKGEAVKGPKVQLYDLSKDLGEKQNLAEQHPEVVERLQKVFDAFMAGLKKGK